MGLLSRKISMFYYLFSLVLLVSIFCTNLFGVLNPSFKNFEKFDDELVLGRLLLTKHHGFFENSGLNGVIGNWGDPNNDHVEKYIQNKPTKKEEFVTYQSQIGGQSLLYSILDLVLPFKNENKLKIFYFLTSFSTALIFLFFLIWVKKHFGILSSFVTLILISLSFWIIIFSNKLWWNLWSFYLPFVFMLFYIDKKNSKKIKSKKIILFSFLVVFIKCLITGYDYISTTLIMFTTPVLFYTVLYQWNFKKAISIFIKMCIGALLAFFSSIAILTFQISKLKNKEDNMNGLEYIYSTLLRRSYDDPNRHEGILFYKSMKSTVWEVIQLYLNGPAYKYKTHSGSEYEVSFLAFIVFFILITVVYVTIKNRNKIVNINKTKFNAILVMFWTSIIAPLSWFILFKGHSYIHTHLNFIVWYMPFALLGYVIVGCFISEVLKSKKIKNLTAI